MHGATTVAAALTMTVMVINSLGNVYALSTWNQSDWSGGQGSSTSNQYASASDINTAVAGQLSLGYNSTWCNNIHCDNNWLYRKKVSFDNTNTNLGVTSENLIDFPVLVKLTSANIDYAHINNDGSDIRFTDGDGTDLPYEIEKWDEAGTSWVWVKVPQINQNSSTDFIYMYYANVAASDHQQASGVWDSNFKGVWHLKEQFGATVSDSTQFGRHGTKGSVTSPAYQPSGQVGAAQQFSNSTVQIPSLAVSTTTGQKNTVSFWMKWDGTGDRSMFSWGTIYYSLFAYTSTPCFGFNTGNGDCWGVSSNGLANQWVYVTAKFHNGPVQSSEIYINGVQQPTSQFVGGANTQTLSNTMLQLGRLYNNGYEYIGGMDEVRVSSGDRSSAHIAASYKSETDDFASLSSLEQNVATSGNLTSNILDLGYGGDWGVLSYTTDKPSFTTVKVRTSDDPGMAGAPAFAGCAGIASGTDLTGQSCVTNNHRYVQYQVTLNVDSGTTPTLQDVAIQYDPWDTDPPDTNASNLSMKKSAGGSSVTSGGWTNGSSPYFEWDTGADNSGGSGIKGYCLYLGQDNSGNPVTTKGLLGTSPVNTEGACQFAVSTGAVGKKGVVIQSVAGQTADFLQAQDSTGAVLAKIDASGHLTVKNAAVQGTLTVTDSATFNGNFITFSNNVRGYNVSVTAAATSQTVSFLAAHPDANYSVFCTPNWSTTCYVSNKTTSGFTLNYGTAAPAAQLVDWFVAR